MSIQDHDAIAGDTRWAHALNGLRVLVFHAHDETVIGYGTVTGYHVGRQAFYVVLEDAETSDPEFVGWEQVRPA